MSEFKVICDNCEKYNYYNEEELAELGWNRFDYCRLTWWLCQECSSKFVG